MVIAIITEYKLNAWGASGLFIFYGVMCTLFSIFVQFFLKETSGLTDMEKKELYTPSKYLEDNQQFEYDDEQE